MTEQTESTMTENVIMFDKKEIKMGTNVATEENAVLVVDGNQNDGAKTRTYDPVVVRFYRLLNCIFNMCELAGFHIEGRITMRHKRTGRMFR